MKVDDLYNHIRTINDFPKPGIGFKDITPLLSDPEAFKTLISVMSAEVKNAGADVVLGLEARGFLMGAPVALELQLPFVPARKPGKLPADTVEVEYDLEYGSACLQVHRDSLQPGQKVAIVDDLIATGGTALAAIKLIEQLGGEVAGCFFALELAFLNGREKLAPCGVHSIMSF